MFTNGPCIEGVVVCEIEVYKLIILVGILISVHRKVPYILLL